MTQANQIIIYGASGYTGKLIAESLHNRGLAFTAAGRTKEKLHKALDVVAGRAEVANIDAKVATAQHTEQSLVELFTGAKVVVNVTGPFYEIGEVVVKSALQAGCHYLDTTGEQDFMLDMKEKYGAAIDKAVFPGMQGGPLQHVIAGKAVSFLEAAERHRSGPDTEGHRLFVADKRPSE